MTLCYLLDTNILSQLVRFPDGEIARKIMDVGQDTVCTSIIAASELRFGGAKTGHAQLQDRIDFALTLIPVMPFDEPSDRNYAEIRAALESRGTPIGNNDMLIAAHALTLDVKLVTDNIAEFQRVDGLTCENWLR